MEDTDYTVDDLRNLFGDKVATLVEGLTKIKTVLDNEDKAQQKSMQAENFKRILLTLNDDVRVVLIKLADRITLAMNKNRHIICELQEFFANNDACKAINSISTIMNSLRIQSKVIGLVKNPKCKFTCLQVLQLLLLFPFFARPFAFATRRIEYKHL